MKYVAIVFLFVTIGVRGQVIDELPTVDGQIVFSEVITIENVGKDELYARAKIFFIDQFKSGKDVIQLDDKAEALVIGRGFSDIYLSFGITENMKTQMWYKIKIQGKEGRYKYDIFDIQFTSYSSQYAPSSTGPAEGIFDKSTYYKKNGNAKDINYSYKQEMLKSITSTQISLKKAMAIPVAGKSEW
jgi:hypothetical protein